MSGIQWFVCLAVFCFVMTVIEAIVDGSLGVTERLKDLPGWKRVLHQLMYWAEGILFCALFLWPSFHK